jgi:hypothetical protein
MFTSDWMMEEAALKQELRTLIAPTTPLSNSRYDWKRV